MKKEAMPLNVETMNALVDAMGMLALCIARQLTPAQRTSFATDIGAMAKKAEREENLPLETMLIDLFRMVNPPRV